MHYRKSSISIFQQFFASIDKIIILGARFEIFLIFPNFLNFQSLKSFGNSWGNTNIQIYTQIYSNMFITTYHSSFHLWPKESLLKQRSLKILWPWLSAKYYFAFYHFITAEIVQNSHILAGIYFVFLKILLDQAWKSFNAKFTHQWKYRKERYLVRPVLTIFCDLVRP